MEAVCNSDESLSRFIGDLRELYRQYRYVKVKATTGRKRSISQNDQTYVWYAQVARELREDTEVGVRRFCKLHFGVPIMRMDSDYRDAYDSIIKPLAYELKLRAMDHWPVTSLMSKDQIAEFQKAMQDHYGPLGVRLEYLQKPEPTQ